MLHEESPHTVAEPVSESFPLLDEEFDPPVIDELLEEISLSESL
jgi:hypothetical protein